MAIVLCRVPSHIRHRSIWWDKKTNISDDTGLTKLPDLRRWGVAGTITRHTLELTPNLSVYLISAVVVHHPYNNTLEISLIDKQSQHQTAMLILIYLPPYINAFKISSNINQYHWWPFRISYFSLKWINNCKIICGKHKYLSILSYNNC